MMDSELPTPKRSFRLSSKNPLPRLILDITTVAKRKIQPIDLLNHVNRQAAKMHREFKKGDLRHGLIIMTSGQWCVLQVEGQWLSDPETFRLFGSGVRVLND